MNDTNAGVNRIVMACVMALCAITCILIFLLPADSLVVDLIYQGF
jgi:hypothetical protein